MRFKTEYYVEQIYRCSVPKPSYRIEHQKGEKKKNLKKHQERVIYRKTEIKLSNFSSAILLEDNGTMAFHSSAGICY